MKLDALSAGNGDLANMVVKTMLAEHRLLAELEFYKMVGNSDSLRKASSASGGAVRAVNSDYSGVAVTPTFATPSLKIFGDLIKTDQANERRGADIVSVRARDLKTFARRASKNLANYVINGTGNTNQPTGLKALCDSGQKFYASSSSAALTLELGNSDAKKAVQSKVKELLQQGIEMVDGGAQAIIMASSMISRLTAVAEDQVQWIKNELGVPVAYFNGIPIIGAGYTNAGTQIIAGDETHGTITGTCYSVYFARFGEASDITIASNNGVNVTDKGLVGSSYEYNIDFDLEFALENDKALAKLEGLKLG